MVQCKVALLTLFLLITSATNEKVCDNTSYTIDITDGELDKDGNIRKNNTIFAADNYFHSSNNTVRGCVCNVKTCIQKCCDANEQLVGKECVASQSPVKLPVDVYDEMEPISEAVDFHIIYGVKKRKTFCTTGSILLFPNYTVNEEPDNFYIQRNGSLYLPLFDDKGVITNLNLESYCGDIVRIDWFGSLDNEFSVLVCPKTVPKEIESQTFTGMIISMPFLLATFIAYALLPDRNLHMKALMSYVINLMFSYLLLVIVQLNPNRIHAAICTTMGYFILFFFMVSFFWMNVICIDIWFAFSGLRGAGIKSKSSERRRFLFYSLYAWGMSIFHVLVVFGIQNLAETNKWYNPGIGDAQCFLRKQWPELLYFYGPMAILITSNVVLFGITACKIRRIKQDTSMLKREDSKRHSYENDKQTFNLYLKLLFAMGVNWSMEIISWAVDWATGEAPQAIWYFTDFCNAIYGVFIFFIFVFKRSIWKLLKKRYYSFMGKPYLAHSMTQNPSTRVTSYSTTNSSVHDNHHGGHDAAVLTSEA